MDHLLVKLHKLLNNQELKGPKVLQRGSNPRIKTEYLKQSLPEWYKNEFKIKWQDAWNTQRSKWQSVVDQIKDTFSIVNSGLETFTKLTEEQWEVAKNTKKKTVC